jgi:hypothetical protein
VNGVNSDYSAFAQGRQSADDDPPAGSEGDGAIKLAGWLASHPDCAQQKIALTPNAQGIVAKASGIVFIGVEHDGDI